MYICMYLYLGCTASRELRKWCDQKEARSGVAVHVEDMVRCIFVWTEQVNGWRPVETKAVGISAQCLLGNSEQRQFSILNLATVHSQCGRQIKS